MLPLLLICATAATLRFVGLGTQSFDYDESFTAGLILGGSLGHALHAIPITESTPPLYYVLAWLWSQVFGIGAAGLRALSALAGTALIPVVYATARRLGSQRAALIAAALFAVNPFFIWYSQEARTYALFALLSAASFWSFIRALEEPSRRTIASWAVLSAAALLSHYFAVYLVAVEAVWLIAATRRRESLIATAGVVLTGAALIPLVVSQADNRTQWIEQLSLASRIKEVIKKALTGEVAPTHNWQLAAVALIAAVGVGYGLRRASARGGDGIKLVAAVSALSVLIPLILDVAGLHYLISKNMTPAVVVALLLLALILGVPEAGLAGVAVAAVLTAFFLAISIDGKVDPALQRADYRAAAKAIGAPVRDQVVVTPTLGNMPLAFYRPGATDVGPTGTPAREVIVIDPLPREDLTSRRPATARPPAGFRLSGRLDARSYTLICFSSNVPHVINARALVALVGGESPHAQVWPQAHASGESPLARSLCGGA
jgi:Dolichyl-phosphate-mannose-protein mannosyltransferase